jgi:hypothetical protein
LPLAAIRPDQIRFRPAAQPRAPVCLTWID